MTSPDAQFDDRAPAGLLVLAGDGTILRAPLFFRRALYLEQRDITPSIFHLFDPTEPPHLELHRIYRHAYGATEFHLRVQGFFSTRHGFRYWPAPLPADVPETASAFFLVDDSALLQTHDWDYRRLRREMLNDVQDSLSSYFKNRLATLQLLAETLRDAPEIAAESAPRMVGAVDELKTAFNRVITGIDDIESPTDYQDSPIRLLDLSGVIETWGTAGIPVECSFQDVPASTLIPASSIERILLPVVENALDASPAGTTVEVIISHVDEGFAHVEVIDRGEEMNERVQHRAKDPFFTTRTGQLGLGLAHAREALRDAGGEWKIDSDPDRGTTVTLLLPVTSAAQLFR